MRVFGLSTCDTCRKALAEMRAAGLEPEVVDIRRDGMSGHDRAALVAAQGEAALNRSSRTWRELPEAERAGPPEALLAAHPTLMKRPAIERDGTWTVGWTPAVRAAVLPG